MERDDSSKTISRTSPHEGHRERLRAEYLRHGGEGMPDHRLLELLLTYAIPRKDTNALAHSLLSRFGSLEAVLFAEIPQLTSVEGMGSGAAAFLHLQGGVARRLALRRLEDGRGRLRLKTPLAAARFAIARLGNLSYERAELVCLDMKRAAIHMETLSAGTVAEAPVYPRRVAETALLKRAHSVLLLHNHPSGDPSPSPEDAALTASVRAALAPLDIALLDHLIVGGARAYSFAANAALTPGEDDAPPPREYA